MRHHDEQYLELLQHIKDNGVVKGDRTGTGTTSVFGTRMEFDLSGNKIPLLTTKKVYVRAIIHELIWMLSGDTNIRYLKENNVNIWDSWVAKGTEEYVDLSYEEKEAYAEKLMGDNPTYRKVVQRHKESSNGDVNVFKDSMVEYWRNNDVPSRRLIAGELHNIYQHQWRKWEDTRIVTHEEYDKLWEVDNSWVNMGLLKLADGDKLVIQRKVDQISNVIERLKTNPDCRRLIVSAWNVPYINEMSLPPCHFCYQFWTRELTVPERLELYDKDNDSIGLKFPPEFRDIWEKYQSPMNDNNFNKEDYILITRGGACVYEHKNVSGEQHMVLDGLGIPRRALSCQMNQRSADFCLGVPFNIVQYSILTHMVAQSVNMIAERFIWIGGDTHEYLDQQQGANEQLKRKPLDYSHATVRLNPDITNIFDFTSDDIAIYGYESHPEIKFPKAAV